LLASRGFCSAHVAEIAIQRKKAGTSNIKSVLTQSEMALQQLSSAQLLSHFIHPAKRGSNFRVTKKTKLDEFDAATPPPLSSFRLVNDQPFPQKETFVLKFSFSSSTQNFFLFLTVSASKSTA
jgi:hypothetical protein